MNLLGELLGWTAFMIALGYGIILWRKNTDWRAQLRARETARAVAAEDYGKIRALRHLAEQQKAAIEQAIAVIEGQYPDFPADVRDQLLAAHEAAGSTTRRQN